MKIFQPLQSIPPATIISWIITIIGWLVAVFCAIIPLQGVKKKQSTFEQELAKLKATRAESVDHATFLNERQDLIDKLSNWQRGLELGNTGVISLNKLDQTVARIESYAKRIPFNENDQNTISRFKTEIRKALTTRNTQQFSGTVNGKIEEIKLILQKGDYQVW